MRHGTLTIAENLFVAGDEIYIGFDPIPYRVTRTDRRTNTITIRPISFWRALLYGLVMLLD